MLLGYFGPETTLPLTSVVATVAGCLLIGGRRLGRLAAVTASQVGESIRPRRRSAQPRPQSPGGRMANQRFRKSP